jgi:FKBP-type peptidyl-prolyl cis-trans isomerase (trigger factor)
VTDIARELRETQQRLDVLKEEILADLRNALEEQDRASRRVVEITETAREAGISWRELAAGTGRSHEYFRALVARAAKKR